MLIKNLIVLTAFSFLFFNPQPVELCAFQDENSETQAAENETTESDDEQDSEQDSTTEPESTNQDDDSLAGLKNQWVELNKKLDEKQAELADASQAEQESIIAEHEVLIASANALVERIKQAAIDEVSTAATEEKQPVYETLVGCMINDANFGREAEFFRVGQSLIDDNIDANYFEVAKNVERLEASGQELFDELTLRMQQVADNLPQVKISTTKGDLLVELFEKEAPDTVGNFISLVESDFYDGQKFFSVSGDSGAVTGCPNGDGTGDPGYQIKCECYNELTRNHFAGSLSMEHSGKPNTGGSQFMICTGTSKDNRLRDNKHTVFGRIISGFDVLEKLQQIDPSLTNQPDADTIVSVEVIRKTEGKEYQPNKIAGSEAGGDDNDSEGDQSSDDQATDDGENDSSDDGDGQ